MKLTVTKDVFLSNPSNKQRFIEVVGQRLSARGCKVLHDQSDADVLIAKTAIESAASMDTILVRDDIDLLILLIHHAADMHLLTNMISSLYLSARRIPRIVSGISRR